jgi:hypothetical protein
MATDYAEKERAFIASLNADTGADLGGWMRAIIGSGLENRNDIIDWLRHQGFTFAKASWLERIHHNGGRLIYAGDAAAPAATPAPSASAAVPSANAQPRRKGLAAYTPARSPEQPVEPPAYAADTHEPIRRPGPLSSDIETVLEAAKGLRPLAMLALGQMRKAVPDSRLEAQAPYVMIAASAPFAALLPGAKELRIYADFGVTDGSRIKRADAANKLPPPFPEVLVLNDARRVDDVFLELIASARGRARG